MTPDCEVSRHTQSYCDKGMRFLRFHYTIYLLFRNLFNPWNIFLAYHPYVISCFFFFNIFAWKNFGFTTNFNDVASVASLVRHLPCLADAQTLITSKFQSYRFTCGRSIHFQWFIWALFSSHLSFLASFSHIFTSSELFWPFSPSFKSLSHSLSLSQSSPQGLPPLSPLRPFHPLISLLLPS